MRPLIGTAEKPIELLVMKHMSGTVTKYLSATSLLLLVAAAPALTGYFDIDEMTKEKQRVLLDYATFAGDNPDSVRLELYYQIYNDALPFREVGNGYEAEFEVFVAIEDDKDNRVTSYSDHKTVTVADRGKTESMTDYRTNQLNFNLSEGKYKAKLILTDKHSATTYRRELEMELDEYDSKYPDLSDIELVQMVAESSNPNSSFSKGDIAVVPSLTGSYESADSAALLYYFEIYRGSNGDDEITVETSLRHERKGLMYRDTITVNLTEAVTRQIREVSLDGYYPGNYELNIKLRGRRFKKVAEKETDLIVTWTQKALVKHDYKVALDQLEYIADPGIIGEMRDVKGLEDRQAALDSFWLERDPNPATEVNELKVTFYHRINVANRVFDHLYYEGWRSDRGRVFIIFGEPDQIDDYPFSPNSRPYQKWHYYRRGQYRKFTFVDENEDGDYRLIYPYDGLYQRPDF